MAYRNRFFDVALKTNTNIHQGLSQNEANKRLLRNGLNELVEEKKKSVSIVFFEQFKDPMVVILLVGAGLSVTLGEKMDALIILFVITMNAMIGTVQVIKSEKALEALKHLIHPTCTVLRDSQIKEINSNECVIGDIVEFSAGDCIPCDVRLIETTHLKIDESLLTGESEPSQKNEQLVFDREMAVADRINMAFMSTYVSSGRGRGIVVACGMDSEVGKIADLLNQDKEEMTPLQRRLGEMGKLLGFLSILLCVVMFVIAMIQGKAFFDMLLIAISLAVAAIPEGLPAVVTIVQAMGVTAMSNQYAIVRKLHAVETLGSVSVICSDKTGTLTQNKMHVVSTYCNHEFDTSISKEFLDVCILCHHVSYDGEKMVGDPSEKALVEFALDQGLNKDNIDCEYIKVDEVPFDSMRKKMSTIHQVNQETVVLSKGAPDFILEQCTHILIHGKIVPLSAYEKQRIHEANKKMAKEALRVLGLAIKKGRQLSEESYEKESIFVGLAGLIDPPKEEVREAIARCHLAGISTVMITGDSHITAFAIAKQLNLAKSEQEVMSGDDIDHCRDEQLSERCKSVKVFARVSPLHKVRLVDSFKKNGHIVAMSGDGVNDAPALKSADIGIAMGKGGSDVCKSAADILLVDDNFATIVNAIEAGRNIYLKIQKAVFYLLSCNLGEIMTLFLAVVLLPHGIPPLCAIQILWVNLVTDAFPALALGVEPDNPHVMSAKPRKPSESLFAHGGYSFIICNGLLIGTISLVAFKYGLQFNESVAQTMSFMVLSLSQLFHSLNCRSQIESIFSLGFFKNKWLILTFVFGVLLQIGVCHFPLFNAILKTTPLLLTQWFLIFALSSSTILLNEVSKYFGKTH